MPLLRASFYCNCLLYCRITLERLLSYLMPGTMRYLGLLRSANENFLSCGEDLIILEVLIILAAANGFMFSSLEFESVFSPRLSFLFVSRNDLSSS